MPDHEITITRANADDTTLITQLSITTFVETFAADNRKEDMDKYIAEDMSEDRLREELADTANRFFPGVGRWGGRRVCKNEGDKAT